MKVLHVASFNGNIGDNAHHNGLYDYFEKNFYEKVKWDQLEIREFYRSWNMRKFDEEFVELANRYDFLVIGGGNFFEICHEYSQTGCTIDITVEILEKIKCPVLFNALGFDINKGYSEKTKKDFEKFIKYIADSKNCFVTFRNDGSKDNFEETYGELYEGIHVVPDGGFFLNLGECDSFGRGKYIGINLAVDMFDKRVKNASYEEFCCDMSRTLERFLENHKDYTIMFFPHIFTDLKIISDVVGGLKDYYIKYNVMVLPYVTSQGSEIEFFNHYRKCDLITGFRFHTNVCAISQGIPTIGLVTYPKVGALYREIGLEHRLIDVNDENFFEQFLQNIEETLERNSELKQEYKHTRNKLVKERNKVYAEMKVWLESLRQNNVTVVEGDA